MSFNIRYGTAPDGENAWPKRRDLVIDRIRAHDPDVLALQEALRFQIDELLAALPGYASIGVGRDDGKTRGEHAAILYRASRLSPVAAEGEPAHGDFWFSDTPEKPGSRSWGNTVTRICTWARLSCAEGLGAFYVYNLHLDHQSQASRERSAAMLAGRVASRRSADPVIVAGDFNAGETNPAILYLVGRAPSVPALSGVDAPPSPALRDTYRVAHPREREAGTFNGFAGRTTGEKIDFVLVDDGWTVLDADIDRTMPDGRCPSDHFPVVATLARKKARTSP
jgi:endonuclease/exonuclease/phosphatase family metal-dependent hydrolase